MLISPMTMMMIIPAFWLRIEWQVQTLFIFDFIFDFIFFFHVFKTVNFGCFAMFCYEESYFLDLLQVRKANDTH